MLARWFCNKNYVNNVFWKFTFSMWVCRNVVIRRLSLISSGKNMYLTPLYSKYATSVELRHFCRLHSSDGVDMSFIWITHEFPSRSSRGNFIMASGVRVGSTRDTRTVWRAQWLSVASHLLNWKRDGQSWLAFHMQVSCRRVWSTTHSGVGGQTGSVQIWSTIYQQLRVPDLPPVVSLTDWASCPQQVILVTMRPVVSTAQSMIRRLSLISLKFSTWKN